MTAVVELPVHGTNVNTCPCPSCTTRRSRYQKNWRIAQHLGLPSNLVDAAPALDHIRDNLLPAAWTMHQIEYAAELSSDYVAVLLKRQPPRIFASTADAILGLGPGDRFRNVPDGAQLDATGTRRRLQALAVKGHPIRDVLRGLRCNSMLMSVAFVEARNARRVAGIYDELWNVEGPSPVGATRARNRGWAGPGAWDDATIDDPRAFPDLTGHCGTVKGYWIHRDRGIPRCQPCKDAEAERSAEYKAARAAARQEVAA